MKRKIKKSIIEKIDATILNIGRFTLPKDNLDMFLQGDEIKLGDKKKITVVFNRKEYDGEIRHVNRKAGDYYHLAYSNELKHELRKEFVQSYIAIMSQKLANESTKKFRTNLPGGVLELIKVEEVAKDKFAFKTYVKIESPYSKLFEKLIDNNVFAWLDVKECNDNFFSFETEWLDKSLLKNHLDAKYVIYYLVDEKKKEIYIGSAKRLKDRVKLGRSEIPGWNLFRYEVLKPEFYPFLRQIEYHSIRNFGRFLSNKYVKNLNISKYKIVNKDFKGYYKKW